jgi:hypothetical protein
MSFLIVTGPTNAGKTTYASALAANGTLAFSFDHFYHKTKHKAFFINRYHEACIALVTDAVFAYEAGNTVVCEGPQFLVPSILHQTFKTLPKSHEAPQFIILAPTIPRTFGNLIARNKGKKRNKRIYIEQFILTLTSFAYFHFSKRNLINILKKNNVKFTILEDVDLKLQTRILKPQVSYHKKIATAILPLLR